MLSRLSKQLFLSSSTSRGLVFQKWSHTFSTQAATSTAGQNYAADGIFTDKIFASYSVYKGKAALSASPRLPTFAKLQSGGVKVDRKGTIMLTFWPAIGERKYDWEKKQYFALSATEVGSMINLGPQDSCEFFHDPAMLSSNAGQVRKSLSIKPHADGSGYFFSLIMRTAFSFALPRIMGWDRYNNQPFGSANNSSSKVLPRAIDEEWGK